MKCCNENKKCGLIKIILICAGIALALVGLVVVLKKFLGKCPICGKKACECDECDCDCLDEECCCEDEECCCCCGEMIEEAAEAVEEKAEDVSDAIEKKANELFD
ncbi:MAG: hypothetical protein IKV54_04245 [Clostridia bacterium]|nr:hypothetical protein [Clostridia bacterium]